MNIIEFEENLFKMRENYYRYPCIDIIKSGFRPVSGMPADFCVIEDDIGSYHFFYIERRLLEGSPFYPGNEIYFGHAITKDFFSWTVEHPVMVIRQNSWEEAHIWAPSIIKYSNKYIMAYTGCNRYLCQDIGLAFSNDLFLWERSIHNPISPCRNKSWSYWKENHISSCRDPNLFYHDKKFWINYTANTSDGASCIALCSSEDLIHWEDQGPILIGPKDGYEPNLNGKHKQGSLESSNLINKNNRWYLLVQFKKTNTPITNWIFESKDMYSFDLYSGREFWANAYTVEIVKNKNCKSLLACSGPIRFGEVNWNEELPAGSFISTEEQLRQWSK